MSQTQRDRRIVSVRYRVAVYADVDLDTGEVIRVVEDDESVRLDRGPHGTGPGPALTTGETLDLVEEAYGPDALPYRVPLTAEVADRAIDIAENRIWPEWERP